MTFSLYAIVNSMKILVLAVLIIAAFLGYQSLVGTARSAYEICIEVAKADEVAVQNLTCGAKREVLEDLARCIVTVQKESNINSFLYNPMGYKSEVDTMIGTHNAECQQSRVEIPEEGLYVTY